MQEKRARGRKTDADVTRVFEEMKRKMDMEMEKIKQKSETEREIIRER